MPLRIAALTLAVMSVVVVRVSAQPSTIERDMQLEFFEKRIRPLLSEHCYKCHSAQSEKLKGGLRLDGRELLLKGGDSGPAVVPG